MKQLKLLFTFLILFGCSSKPGYKELLDMGEKAERSGDFQKAIHYYKQAIEADPNKHEPYNLLSSDSVNEKLILDYRNVEVTGDTSVMKDYLDASVTAYFKGTDEPLKRDDILQNSLFTRGFNPGYKLQSTEILDDNTIRIETLETDELKRLLGVRPVAYKYTYTIKDRKIFRIFVDTLENADYNYREIDQSYNKKMSELIAYISADYPEKYQKLQALDEASATILLEAAKEKYRR